MFPQHLNHNLFINNGENLRANDIIQKSWDFDMTWFLHLVHITLNLCLVIRMEVAFTNGPI